MGFSIGRAIAAAGTGGLSEVGRAAGLFDKGRVTPADPEAAELRKIKLLGAKGEAEALKRFRKRLDEDTSGIIRSDIAREQQATRAGAEDATRGLRARIAQQGLQRSSIGQQAEANLQRDVASDVGRIGSTFRKRLDQEKLKRLTEFRNVAAGTLANQDVGIRFQPTKEESFGRQLIKGAVTAGVGGFSRGAGQSVGSGGARGKRRGGGNSANFKQSEPVAFNFNPSGPSSRTA